MALARRIDVVPGAGARGPDVCRDLHPARIIERTGAHHDESGIRVAVAVDRRAAIAAEVAAQRAPALGRAVVVLFGFTLRDAEAVRRYDRVDGAAAAGRFLAVEAMAGTQRGDRRGNRVANRAAEATTVKRCSHRCSSTVISDATCRPRAALSRAA